MLKLYVILKLMLTSPGFYQLALAFFVVGALFGAAVGRWGKLKLGIRDWMIRVLGRTTTLKDGLVGGVVGLIAFLFLMGTVVVYALVTY